MMPFRQKATEQVVARKVQLGRSLKSMIVKLKTSSFDEDSRTMLRSVVGGVAGFTRLTKVLYISKSGMQEGLDSSV
jgi:hypothetical protein